MEDWLTYYNEVRQQAAIGNEPSMLVRRNPTAHSANCRETGRQHQHLAVQQMVPDQLSEEQILGLCGEKTSVSTGDISRKHGISSAACLGLEDIAGDGTDNRDMTIRPSQ